MNTELTPVMQLKDGRELLTSDNGFTFWVKSKKGKIDKITEQQYNKAKQHRETKRQRR